MIFYYYIVLLNLYFYVLIFMLFLFFLIVILLCSNCLSISYYLNCCIVMLWECFVMLELFFLKMLYAFMSFNLMHLKYIFNNIYINKIGCGGMGTRGHPLEWGGEKETRHVAIPRLGGNFVWKCKACFPLYFLPIWRDRVLGARGENCRLP